MCFGTPLKIARVFLLRLLQTFPASAHRPGYFAASNRFAGVKVLAMTEDLELEALEALEEGRLAVRTPVSAEGPSCVVTKNLVC